MIFILNKQEKVINVLKNGGGTNSAPPFFDDVHTQDLTTGAETFTFSTIAIGDVARDLSIGNYVAFRDEFNHYKLFQIVQTEESHEDAMYVTVYAEGAGLELINKVFRARKAPSTSLRRFMEMVLDETGWNVGAIPATSQDSLDLDLADATVYFTLQSTLAKYGVEMAFRVEINNGRVSSKFIDLYKQRGKVTGKRFAFGKDIEGIKRKVDSTELFTALIGRGNKDINFKDVTIPEIPNKPLGQDFVFDQGSYDLYNNNGYHIMGIFKFDTDSPEELLRETYKKLQECKEPKIEYEVSVALLGQLLGQTWNRVAIGDTVAIVDNSFNPPIHLMARVSKLDKSFTNPQGDTCTLANFIEVKSNITDEMRNLASQLEGMVDSKFPIKSEDISEGAVTGDKIYKDTISTDHLMADAITANKIKADSIETKHIKADQIVSEHIASKQIEAEHIKAGTITANEIATGTITAESGIIADATIGTAQIKDAEITVAKIQDAFVDNLVASQGKFQSAHIGELTADNIGANTITAEKITASVIEAINMSVSGTIDASKINVKDLVVDNIDAGKITTGTLDADRITSSVISAINASIENATIDSAKIGELDAGKITTGSLNADLIKTNVISAINASIGSATIDSAKIGNLDASKITTGELSADRIKAGSIDASKINADTITAIEVSASEITADKIASGEIKVGDANIVDGTISGAKITKASIGNAQINEAFIADAYINSIVADKIKGGTLDAGEITVTNLRADSITVGQINGMQIANGAIDYDKLDGILSGDIRNTIDNVDQALKDVGLIQEDVQGINETLKETVTSVDVMYAISSSTSTAPTSGWQTTSPQWQDGKYIWSKTVTTYADNRVVETTPTCLSGATGQAGASGKGVKTIVEHYYLSTSNTQQTGGSWTTTVPTWESGKYIWTKSVITYTDNSSTSTNPVCVSGAKGDKGDKGNTGEAGATGQGVESITEEYYLSTSKTAQSGGSWVTTPPTWSTGKYLWTRSKVVYKNPSATVYTTPVCDSSWEAVNEVEVGSRNLWVLKSLTSGYEDKGNIISSSDVHKMTNYLIELNGAKNITVQLWNPNKISNSSNSNRIAFYDSNKVWISSTNTQKPNGISYLKATYDVPANAVYARAGMICGATAYDSSIKIKVELGNKGTDWTPAPEDVDNEISKVTTIANGKNSVYYSTSAPSVSGKKENDIWFDTDDGHRMYSFTGGKWVATQFGTNAISAEAITAGKIASGAVTTDKLYSLAVTADKISANAITAGKIATDAVLANNIKAGAVTTDKVSAKAINADKLDVDNLFVGDNAFIKKLKAVEIDASNITTGTISNDRIDIRGLISFEALDASLKPVFNVQGDKTYINGGLIATNTIKANSIDLLSGLTVKGEDGQNTFSIASNGEVEVNGLLKSGNFDENKNTGYRLSTDGKAILNQAVVKGDVILPSAGMTNYGGQIGNKNLVKNSDFSNGNSNWSFSIASVDKTKLFDGRPTLKLTRTGATTDTWNGAQQDIDIQGNANIKNQAFTVSFWYYVEDKSTIDTTIAVELKGKNASGGHITAGSYWSATKNTVVEKKWTYVSYTFTPTSSDLDKLFIYPWIKRNGTVWFARFKVERSNKATPWCPHPLEQLNHVRIWAGTNYENRENAKFRVYDNGDIYATDGTFSGKMYGDLDSGLVHIHNNEIVINSVATFMDESGVARSVAPMDYNPNPYLRLGAGTSILNTDLILGSETDRKIEFLNSNRQFNFNNTSLNLSAPTRTSGANFSFNPKGNYNSAFSVGSVIADTDATLTIGYHNGAWANTSIITHNGSRGGANGDICFKRSDNTENLNVYVQGNMKVKNSIQSSIQNIEMRSVSNEGWGFYAT